MRRQCRKLSSLLAPINSLKNRLEVCMLPNFFAFGYYFNTIEGCRTYRKTLAEKHKNMTTPVKKKKQERSRKQRVCWTNKYRECVPPLCMLVRCVNFLTTANCCDVFTSCWYVYSALASCVVGIVYCPVLSAWCADFLCCRHHVCADVLCCVLTSYVGVGVVYCQYNVLGFCVVGMMCWCPTCLIGMMCWCRTCVVGMMWTSTHNADNRTLSTQDR
jgi:hypothetical protein